MIPLIHAGVPGIPILLAASAVVALLVWTGLWALRRRRPRTVRRPAAAACSADHLPHRAAREAASLVSRPILLPDPSWGWWPISDGGLLEHPETAVDG